jgi:16S rRNA G966 N2-methylase RsmD
MLSRMELISAGAIICVEHEKSEQISPPMGIEIINTKTFGATQLDFLECN